VDAPPRARELRHEVPEGLEAVVQTALQKEPERRFQTAEEMAGSLDLVSGGFEAMAAEALRRLLGPRYRWLHGRRLAALITAAALALVVTVLAVQTYVRGPSFSGPLATYVILPWTGGATTEQEAAIAERAARWLGVHLEDWESLRVVAEHALEGHLADIQLAGVGLPTYTLSTALSLAGQLGASHVVHVYATEVGDSVVLVTRITAREGPQESEQSFRGEGHEDELEVITAELALEMLGLFDEDVGYDDLVARSPNHLAHQEFQEGRQALRDWRLAEAERLFREALAQDSAFALAHHYLAQTLYWRTARDKERLWDLGPEIEHHSRRAVQYDVSGRLRPLERSHVDAFHAFWTGDFTGARARYDTLLALDPTDLEGLILRGSVELSDPWLVRERDGSLRPQLDLDLARAMYDSSARLSSTWQLAWGRLYDIDVMLARSAFRNDCLGFHPPDYEETLTPYSKGEASVVAMFCPLVDDGSIVWRAESLSDEDKARAQEGVRQTHEQTTARLERWALVEKDQPRHREELADWMLWERSLKGCAADPAEADSLARLALDHIQRALADRGDTTAEDRVRLAAIAMFDGELEEAARAMDEALDELGNWRSADGPTPPTAAVNPYLAAGDVQMAKAIIEAIFGANTAAVTDPADPDHAIDMTGSFAPLYMLDAIGYLGETGPEVQSVFETLADLWSDERYTDRERAILHWVGLDFAGPALVYFPDLWAEWLDDLGEQGLDMPAVWRGLRIADSRPEEALTALGEVLSDLQREREAQTLRATDYFLPIALAERTGSDSVSAELRRQALACPLALSHADFGWGMRRYLVGE
jgi:tetratricopeptide (TPR) repeat protein